MADVVAPDLITSLIAGAAAGIFVDLTLFPLDTIKTRLQSKGGFLKTGGFSGFYKGIGPVILGSAPTSALFFMTYNTLVNKLNPISGLWTPVNHILAASVAEVVAASLRVPIEIVKQRKQTSLKFTSVTDMLKVILREEGVRGMYRGYCSTILREVPFGAIQYPVWEWLKLSTGAEESWQIGICGACAGAVAATFTTPMDVIKTRVMLAESHLANKHRSALALASFVARDVFHDKGLRGFFAGVVPRVLWITLGGFIYFGVYGKTVLICQSNENSLLSSNQQNISDSRNQSNVIR